MLNMTRDEHFPIDGAIEVLEAIPGPKRMGVWAGTHVEIPPEAIAAREPVLRPHPRAPEQTWLSQAGRTIRRVPLPSLPRPTGAPRPRRCATRDRAGEGELAARAGDGRGARELGRRRGPPPARLGRARSGVDARARASSASPSSPPTGSPSCWRAPRLAAAGRRPVSTPVVAAAVRRVLATEPGPMFAAGRDASRHRGSARRRAPRALRPRRRRARRCSPTRSARAREVVRIHRLVKQQLGAALVRRARPHARRVRRGRRAARRSSRELGTSCATCRNACRRRSRVCSRARRRAQRLVVIAGLTGVAEGRRRSGRERRAARRRRSGRRREPIAPAHGTAVCSISDPDDEVRVVVRGIVDAMRDGVPLERMAVLLGNDEPYARLLHEHLELAGIAHNGVSVRTLADSVLGRALLRLLALARPRLPPRRRVRAARGRSRARRSRRGPVPAVEWERISRDAGVVARGRRVEGPARRTTSASLAARRRRRRAGRRRRGRSRAGSRAFVDELAADLAAAPAHVGGARGMGARARSALDRRRSASRAAGRRSSRRRRGASRPRVDRLGGLDAVEAGADPRGVPAIARARARRGARSGRPARRGRARRVRPRSRSASSSTGCGCAGWPKACSRRRRATIRCSPTPTATRLAGELPMRADRIADDQRALLAALASTAGERVMCFPRGDLRRSTEHVPSRFLLDTIEALSGARARRRALGAPWCTEIPSFVHGLTHAAFPATRHELDVRAALAGEPRIAAVPRSRAGSSSARARRSRELHPLRRQPRAPRRAGWPRRARRRPTSRCRRRGSRRGRSARTRTS